MKKILSVGLAICFGLGFSQKTWTLQECVDYAVKNNLQVLGAQYNSEFQAKNASIAQKDALPSISGNLNNVTNFGNTIGFQGSIGRNDYFSNSASIGTNISLYNHGRIRKNAEKSQFDLDASLLDVEKTKNDISLQVTQFYLQAMLNKEVKKITDEAVSNAEKVLKRARITTEVGTTPKTIEAEASAAFAREKQRQKTAEIDVQRALFNLAVLLQLKDVVGFDVAHVPLPETLPPPLSSSEGIVEKAFDTQPQVKASETRMKAAKKQIEIAKTAFFPSISANAGIGTNYFDSFSNNNTQGFLQQYKDNFYQQVGLSANIPVFNKGIFKERVEQAKISESLAKNSLDLQKQEVRQNVQKAYFDANANYEIYLAALEAERSSKLSLDFAEKSFDAGRTTIYDLNIARNNYVGAQGNVSQAKFNYIFSTKLLNFYAGIPISF